MKPASIADPATEPASGPGSPPILRRTHTLELPAQARGQRLDQALAAALPQYSRARLQRWIRAGAVRVGGAPARARDRVRGGERVTVEAQFEAAEGVEAQPLALQVLYRDEELLVIDKPAGLVVHPGAGNRAHTLQNALLAFDPGLARVPRAGLVHRLDKDTSGLLVVARTPEAHTRLVAALAAREIGREYLALVWGRPLAGGRIEEPIGRDRRRRTRMAVVAGGRAALTHYRIERRFRAHTLLRVRLETGRTHQIRVHLAHAGLPIVGDPVYGGRQRLLPEAAAAGAGAAGAAGPAGAGSARTAGTAGAAGAARSANAALRAWHRQALHAQRLQLRHPASGRALRFEAPLPEDFAALLAALDEDLRRAGERRPREAPRRAGTRRK
ncbi:MAG TPA: RluA family pseudouridine synthase [Steroidobacteraceae bacterium]|nr:RluA family pseudouridine synthase [Steroidobacteraceae bacterium]